MIKISSVDTQIMYAGIVVDSDLMSDRIPKIIVIFNFKLLKFDTEVTIISRYTY